MSALPVSKARRITGIALTTLVVLFLLFDVAIKFTGRPEVTDSMRQLGYPPEMAPLIGVIAGLCLLLYVIPQTSVLGALLLTGYLGGAVATHVRVGNPLALYVFFPFYVGALLWAGLYLRDPRLQALLPFRRQ